MIYNLRHISTYRYQTPVGFARCTLRLSARNDRGQAVRNRLIEVTPAPASQSERSDFFGNLATSIRLETPHRELRITVTAQVDVDRPAQPHAALTPNWEQVRRAVARSQSLAPDAPAHFVFKSPLVPMHAEITDYARESFRPDRPVLEAAVELMRRIREDFHYDPKATDISTPVQEAFRKRTGVCQDFAHVMIAALRGLGLPAAYVSGYIRTIPPPGKPRLEGADASHAWVSVWCGAEFGWQDLDPTNALQVANDHIVLAVGRDYTDVSPIDGVIVGSGGQKLSVSVDVAPVGEDKVAKRA